jgi:hypothetical protein
MTSHHHAPRAIARAVLLASVLSLAPAALAQEAAANPSQTDLPQQAAPQSVPGQGGISIRANVDVVFQPAFREDTRLMQSSFTAGAMGPNATTEYIFSLLSKAALQALNQALAQGAKTGRVTVVATGCEVGVSGNGLQAAQVGIFINTTDMEVGEDGIAHFRTRVKFIPNEAVAPGAVTDPDALPDPERISPKF